MGETFETPPAKDVEKPIAFLVLNFGLNTMANKQRGEALIHALETTGLEVSCLVRDEQWGEKPSEHPFKEAFQRVENSDLLIVDASQELAFGMGIEAGYAKALKKPVVLICPETTQLSPARQDIADAVIRFTGFDDLSSKLQTFTQGLKK